MKGLLSSWWLFLAFAGFLGYLEALPSWLRLLNLLFLWPVVPALVRTAGRRKQGAKPPEPPPAPVAGGKARLYGRFGVSMLLLSTWPPALARQVAQVVGDRRAASRAVDRTSAYGQKVRYSLPFAGEWYVHNGGPDRETSHSWGLVSQRWAFDFTVTDSSLRRWRDGTQGRELADYLCYRAPILAPADGVVVAVEDGIRDAPRPGTGWLDPRARHLAGNHATIQHAEGEYSVLAHLAPESICVSEGERVKRGQQIGKCGSSGNSSEPHLHFQVQDRAKLLEAAGLPVTFDGVAVDGDEPARGRFLVHGTRVLQR